MKLSYTFFTLSLLAVTSITQAQIKKGSIWLGGGIGYSKAEIERPDQDAKSKIDRVDIGPAAGYAIKDNLVVGIDLRYFNRKEDYTSSPYKYRNDNYWGAVFIRKYWNISSKFYAFAHADLGYSKGISKVDFDNGTNSTLYSKSKSWTVSAAVAPGIAYAVSRKVQLESTFLPVIKASYGRFKTDKTAFNLKENHGSDFSVNGALETGQYFTLGIRFLLGK